MIKYFCDFCKKEIPMVGAKPDVEIGITITRAISGSNRTSQKLEHVCVECNEALIETMNIMGFEVDNNGA